MSNANYPRPVECHQLTHCVDCSGGLSLSYQSIKPQLSTQSLLKDPTNIRYERLDHQINTLTRVILGEVLGRHLHLRMPNLFWTSGRAQQDRKRHCPPVATVPPSCTTAEKQDSLALRASSSVSTNCTCPVLQLLPKARFWHTSESQAARRSSQSTRQCTSLRQHTSCMCVDNMGCTSGLPMSTSSISSYCSAVCRHPDLFARYCARKSECITTRNVDGAGTLHIS